MPEWNQGYVNDINYIKSVFSELSPASINFALALSGQPAPDLEKPFTYAELGAGFGLSISSWAAQYPNGEFHSVDFNPAQSAWLAKLRNGAELKNLHVYERSFGQMLSENLPQFDYVVIHGILSWVTDDVRGDIREFLVKFLKPGGVVYLGYNAQPGWFSVGPLRQIILEGGKSMGENNTAAILTRGLNFLKELREAGSFYFKAAGNASDWLDKWFEIDRTYLAGELLNKDHRAFYFSEMADFMAEAKTSYVGSLELANYLESVTMPLEFRKCLERVGGSLSLRETVKDVLYNNTFRRDLFIKGPQALTAAKAQKAVNKVRLVLSDTRNKPPAEQVSIKGVSVALKPEVYGPLMELWDKGPASIEEAAKASGLKGNQVAEAACILLALGWAQTSPPAAAFEDIKKYNLALDELLGSESFTCTLSVNGAWLNLGVLEQLYGLAALKGVEPLKFARETIKEREWTLNHNGQPITETVRLESFLKERFEAINEQLPPVLKRLGLSS